MLLTLEKVIMLKPVSIFSDIAEGAVRVHDGEKSSATLGPGEVFGELAALDPEPRMASVTATEPTLLLRMGHAELGELMTEHPEVAFGIIHVLCRRLRKAK